MPGQLGWRRYSTKTSGFCLWRQLPWPLPLQPFSEVSQFSSSLDIAGGFSVAVPALELRTTVFEQVSLYAGLLRDSPTSVSSSFLFFSNTIPASFHCQMLYRLFFQILVPWSGEPGMRLGPLAPLVPRGTFTAKISLLILNHHTYFTFLPLLPVWTWVLYILTFRICV